MGSRKNDDVRLVLLGHWGVGKTSIVRRMLGARFEENHAATIGAAYSTIRVGVHFDGTMIKLGRTEPFEGTVIRVGVWDTAGQERFRALVPFYTRNSDGAFVVFDNDRETAETAETAARDFRQRHIAENPDATDPPPICLLQNKCDLPGFEFRDDVVDRVQPDCGGSTSALLNDNIDQHFLQMVALCLERVRSARAAREAVDASSGDAVQLDGSAFMKRVRGWCSYL